MPDVAFLSEGQVHLHIGGGEPRQLGSRFAEEVRNRATAVAQRSAWKRSGSGARFMMGLGGVPDADELLNEGAPVVPVAVTGLCRGRMRGAVLYSMSTGPVTGLFETAPGEEERRLRHGTEVYSDPVLHPMAPLVACSLGGKGGVAHLAVMHADGSGLLQVTEGDAVDSRPSWVPNEPQKLVYQSAGVGRDPSGMPAGLGPSAVHLLDVASGGISILAEDPTHDLVAPRIASDGALWCIRAPHWLAQKVPAWRLVVDVLLFPFRLVWAVFGFLNVFSAVFTGKPLFTAGTRDRRRADARRMLLMGNSFRAAQRTLEEDEKPTASPDWQLVRRAPGAAEFEVVATGVAAFDLCGDGSVVWTDGSSVFHRADGRDARLAKGRWIQQVVVLG